MDKSQKVKLQRNYKHQYNEEKLGIEKVEDTTKKRDYLRESLFDNNDQEKLNEVPQLSCNDRNLDFIEKIDNSECKRYKKNYMKYENEAYCDDGGSKSDLLEHKQKKIRLTESSSQVTESNYQDLRKKKRHKQKKMKRNMFSLASVSILNTVASESGDHHSKKTGIRSGKSNLPSHSKTNFKDTIVNSAKKKKIPNLQHDHKDRSEFDINTRIREEFKDILQSPVERKLTDVTETTDVNLSKKKKAKKNSPREEVRFHSKEFSDYNIDKKNKNHKHTNSLGNDNVNITKEYIKEEHILFLGTDDDNMKEKAKKQKHTLGTDDNSINKKCKKRKHTHSLGTDDDNMNKKNKKGKHTLSLGSETIDKSTKVLEDYHTVKKEENRENHQSLSYRMNTCSSDDNHDVNGNVSYVDESKIFRINSYENQQYDNNSLSNIDKSYCQLSESEVVHYTDNIDYDDEHYNVPFRVKKSKTQKKSNSLPVNHKLITSDEAEPLHQFGKNIGYTALATYNTPMYSMKTETDQHNHSDEENVILTSKHSKPQKNFDEMLYSFPPGEGIPPEEVEEIPEEFNHWKKTYSLLDDNEFTVEEIKEELENKINYVYGYFKRLEENSLTEKELEEVPPRNFHGPYLPTYKHLEFFETLDIKITWPLNPLHQSAFQRKEKGKKKGKKNCEYDHAIEEESGFQRDKGRFNPREIGIIIRNWINFQKEYGFYDLRPMISLRTTRILKEGGITTFQPYCYIDLLNKKKFAVYLSQGLPERSPTSVLHRMRRLSSHLVDNQFKRTYKKISGRYLGKMVLMLKMYGKCFPGIELIVGHYTATEFQTFFQTHIWMQNIELRRGVWTEAEKGRLKKGIFDVLKVKSLEEAVDKRIHWVNIMPFVRTRNYRNMRVHLLYEVAKIKKTKKQHNRKDMVKVIEIIYEYDVEAMDAIDWHAVAQHFPDKNPYRLLVLFRKMYYNKVPHKHRLTFEDGIKFLYEKVLPTLLPIETSSAVTNDGVSCEGHAEAEVELRDYNAVSSGTDESGKFADGNINDFKFESDAVSETSEICSIEKDINNSNLYNSDTKLKKNANSVVENQDFYYQIRCSKAHCMSESESE